jgi:hypothetical protein
MRRNTNSISLEALSFSLVLKQVPIEIRIRKVMGKVIHIIKLNNLSKGLTASTGGIKKLVNSKKNLGMIIIWMEYNIKKIKKIISIYLRIISKPLFV